MKPKLDIIFDEINMAYECVLMNSRSAEDRLAELAYIIGKIHGLLLVEETGNV